MKNQLVFNVIKLLLNNLKFILFIVLLLLLCNLIDKKIFDLNNNVYKFAVKSTTQNYTNTANAIFESSLIMQPRFLKIAHSSSLAFLPDNSLIATWFAGSKEGKSDVKIWQASFHNVNWENIHSIVSRESLANSLKIYVKNIGNPTLYLAKNNILHLFVVSVSIGGWSGSSINHLISNDFGNTWVIQNKLVLSPFFNISSLDRTQAITLEDGGFYLPIYHESIHTYPELLYFNKNGKFIKQIRLNHLNHIIQPAIVVQSNQGFIFFRNHINHLEPLLMQVIDSNANIIGNIHKTNIFNQDSSLAVAILPNNKLLMIRNPKERNELVISISNDGVIWQDLYTLEKSQENDEFSYPSIQIHADTIDILYTWKRQYIKHVRFNMKWLFNQLQKVSIS